MKQVPADMNGLEIAALSVEQVCDWASCTPSQVKYVSEMGFEGYAIFAGDRVGFPKLSGIFRKSLRGPSVRARDITNVTLARVNYEALGRSGSRLELVLRSRDNELRCALSQMRGEPVGRFVYELGWQARPGSSPHDWVTHDLAASGSLSLVRRNI